MHDIQSIRVLMLLAATGHTFRDGKVVSLKEIITELKPVASSLETQYICTSCGKEFERYTTDHGCIKYTEDVYKILSVNQFFNNYYRYLKRAYNEN